MTVTTAAGAGPGERRPHRGLWGLWAVVLLGAVAVLYLSAEGSDQGSALSPEGTGSGGAKALSLLVGRLGGRVDLSGNLPAPGGGGVALVLADHLTPAARAGVRSWVRRGGRLVVADISSDLAGAARAEGPSPNSGVAVGTLAPACAAAWVAGVGTVDTGDIPLLARPPGATEACFGAGGGYFAVERPVGRGSVVTLAGPGVWTNGQLAHAGNAVLAADLLAPRSGSVVAWLTGAQVGGGRQSLLHLLPARVDELLLGLAVAFLVVCGWRGRRLGRPVPEAVPVEIPGSELVGAVGRLLARNGQRGHAADLLRSQLRHDVTRLAVTPSMDEETVVAVVTRRTGAAPDLVRATMFGSAPATDEELVELSRAVEAIRQEVIGVHR